MAWSAHGPVSTPHSAQLGYSQTIRNSASFFASTLEHMIASAKASGWKIPLSPRRILVSCALVEQYSPPKWRQWRQWPGDDCQPPSARQQELSRPHAGHVASSPASRSGPRRRHHTSAI